MMADGEDQSALERIAAALERIAPPAVSNIDIAAENIMHWDGKQLRAVRHFRPVALSLLRGIDDQKARLAENSRRHAEGYAAHDILLWGARGMGKSALVKSAFQSLVNAGKDIGLVEMASDQLPSMPQLFQQLGQSDRRFILFIDDIGFDHDQIAPRLLRSMLEGGAMQRPANIRLYVTANQRHIVARQMSEQNDPVNPRDMLDDQLALSDRFGLRLGFHAASQDDYLAIIAGYAAEFELEHVESEALLWAKQRGARSGRVAWQYIVELAGRAGKNID